MKFDDIIKQVEDNPYSAFFYTPTYFKKAVSYLFLKPVEIIPVYKKEDLDYAFKVIHKFIDKRYFGYSLINCEAGFLFEEKLENLLSGQDKKLIQFVFFSEDTINKFKSSKIISSELFDNSYTVSNFTFSRTEETFSQDIQKIKEFIKEGDTYQVNYTVKGRFNFTGSYSSFFQKLLFNQSAKYSAFINNSDEFVISLSPELFFRLKGSKILSQPMKGTIRRGFNQNSDTLAETELKMSEKNQSENVMIVDLIRNDFGRICRFGSVTVPELFKIEKYESLFQMVSTVQGKLRKKTKMKEIIQSIFPCGSVTGAPKIRTMEIINEIEKDERGIYTGSIGLITPDEIKMNVAIRTVTINKNTGDGAMGLGSGIVWDSDPLNEYEEVLLKSKFLTEPLDYFEIFETMRYEYGEIKFLTEHLTRMKMAADFFLFRFSSKKIRMEIENLLLKLKPGKPKKIKFILNKWGKVKSEISDLPLIQKDVSVTISEKRISSVDKFRYFKTTNRKLYDDEYNRFEEKGFYEVLFCNEKDEIAEGSRTNIFLRKGNAWFTPDLGSGALPGIYRNFLIKTKINVNQTAVKRADLFEADEILLTNALRCEVKVNKLFVSDNEFVSFK